MGQPTAAQSAGTLKITGSGSTGIENWQVHDEDEMVPILSAIWRYLFISTCGGLVCEFGRRWFYSDGNLLWV